MTQFFPLRQKPTRSSYKKGDVLVLFGELFSRGYANGLVEEAERLGMLVVRATVGRRDKDGSLRPLNAEEMAMIPQPFINVPLEAGFDLEPDSQGITPCDQLKDVKLSEWQTATLNWQAVAESEKKGRERFVKHTQDFLQKLEAHIPPGANVLFAHLMAGGVPRTKIVMPVLNRVSKGVGDRHTSSSTLIGTDIGKLCLRNFNEVTAESFRHLVEQSAPLRQKIEASGGQVAYTAYGYHGTEVMIDGRYQWQTYTCYFQGWAKMALEQHAERFHREGLRTCVYNCPEILTNSSTVFQGVEVSLYPLLAALQKDAVNPEAVEKVFRDCKNLLKEEVSIESVVAFTNAYLTSSLIQEFNHFEKWPQHSRLDQMEYMIQSSDALFDMHKDPKKLITAVLSEVVFKSCGYVMLHDSAKPAAPVSWIGHDLVVRCM